MIPMACSWLLSHTHVVVGWMFNITFSLALVYTSTWLVRWACTCASMGEVGTAVPPLLGAGLLNSRLLRFPPRTCMHACRW